MLFLQRDNNFVTYKHNYNSWEQFGGDTGRWLRVY